MNVDKTVERSIDTLQRVYAVIVALAINEAIKRTFLKNGSAEVEIHYDHLPQFIALIATAVPFLHGMNRHLDETLAVIRKRSRRSLFVFLIVDFVVFLAEGCILFLLAASVSADLIFFQPLIVLLIVDVLWAFLALFNAMITPSVAFRWIGINGLMIIVAFLIIYVSGPECIQFKIYVLAVCAVIRTILDYLLVWDFYFPPEVPNQEEVTAAA